MSRKVQINKGTIQDNALKALVKSNLFRHKIERNKKAKAATTDNKQKNGRTVLLNRPVLFGRMALRRAKLKCFCLHVVTLYQNKNN